MIVAGLLITVGCGGSNPTNSDNIGFELSPNEWFKFDDTKYPITPQHGPLTEKYWTELNDCMGLHYTPKRFLIILRTEEVKGGWYCNAGLCGGEYHPRTSIEVLGDIHQVQSYKHEMLHYLLDVKTGDADFNHVRGGLVEYYPGKYQGADWLRCTTR
jgi:hypothetical protein